MKYATELLEGEGNNSTFKLAAATCSSQNPKIEQVLAYVAPKLLREPKNPHDVQKGRKAKMSLVYIDIAVIISSQAQMAIAGRGCRAIRNV